MRALLILIILLMGMLGGIFLFVNYKTPLLHIAGKDFRLLVADSPAERAKGLGGRKFLQEDTAMIFVFDTSDIQGFWMKGMEFSIDIIWIDGEKRIVHIEENISPDSYPKVFSPEQESLHVLEANAGFASENNLKEGDRLNFTLSK